MTTVAQPTLWCLKIGFVEFEHLNFASLQASFQRVVDNGVFQNIRLNEEIRFVSRKKEDVVK